MPAKQIWVVDDSPLQLLQARQLLSQDYAVTGFGTGEELLERLAQAAPPDLIMLDWQLPGVSGLEVCRFVRERFDESALPILMLTVRDARADFAEGLEAGANDYLAKPFDGVELFMRVRTLVRIGQQTRAVRERESWLSTTLTSIGDAVITTDAVGSITFLNPAAEALTGWGRTEVQGRPLTEIFLIHNETTRKKVDSPVEKVLRLGAVVGLANHTLLTRKDGSEVPIDDSAAPIRGEGGALLGVVLVFRDQTEARRREHELRAAQALAQAEQAKQHALFMQTPVPIAILEGPRHVFTFANPAYRALVNGRDVVGKPLHEALPDVKDQGFDVLLDRVMATGETFFGKEVPIKLEHHAGDELLILNFVYTPKRDFEGKVDGVLMSGFEVTEQVLARWKLEALASELRQSQARLQRVVDASGAGLWDLDAATNFIKADARLLELLGAPAGEPMTLQSALDALHPEDRERVRRSVAAALAGEDEGRYLTEFRSVRAADGEVRWVESRGQVRFDEQGKATHLAGAMIDISARKVAEAARESALSRVAEVLESMGDAFFALDPSWRVTLVNRRYEQVSRKTREETLGRDFWKLFPDAANPQSLYFQNYHRSMAERVEVQFVDYYASLDVWTDVRVYPTKDGGIAVFFRDVSVERRAEQAIKRQTEFEQQLIGIVSHDLRNPLNAILLSSNLLVRREELDERAVKGAVRIQNAAQRASAMVKDLLDFTQARLGGGIPIEPRATDLRQVVRGVLDEVEAAYPGRELIVSHEGETQGVWDPDRLGQVLQNLAVNAVKYSPEGTAVRVGTTSGPGWVSLTVHNTGTPISAEMMPRIFEPLRRGTSEMDRTGRSIGLGLYIVKQVVDAHEGTVSVRSDEASGTTFTVRLPMRGW